MNKPEAIIMSRNKKGQFVRGSSGFTGKHTEETKKKLKVAWKRRIIRGEKFGFQKGKLNPSVFQGVWNKGTKGICKANNGSIKKGQLLKEETKRKIREWQVNNPNRIFKNTSIELKVEEELMRRNINYQKQVPLCKVAIVDFYLPEYRIIIQCDGEYWHNRPKQKEKDEQQNKVLTFNGFNVYRFWENKINRSVKECIDKLKLI